MVEVSVYTFLSVIRREIACVLLVLQSLNAVFQTPLLSLLPEDSGLFLLLFFC